MRRKEEGAEEEDKGRGEEERACNGVVLIDNNSE